LQPTASRCALAAAEPSRWAGVAIGKAMRHPQVINHCWICAGVLAMNIAMLILGGCYPVPLQSDVITVSPIASLPYPYPGPYEFAPTPDYQAMLEAKATSIALIIAHATTAVYEFTTSPYPTVAVTPYPTGTQDDEYVHASGKMLGFKVENAWFGYVDGNSVSVWAGTLPSLTDTDQGMIEVMWHWPYRIYNERFLTPTKRGAVRIIAEHNNRLVLRAADGTLFYFDLPGLRFVETLNEGVPSALPPPTYTPFVIQPYLDDLAQTQAAYP
jgi:hypothetical protein